MRALSIRQPYVELILRGIKTVEYRSRPTRIIGERFYLYAAKKWAENGGKAWSTDLAMPGAVGTALGLPRWMIELAEQIRMVEPGALLPTGVIVGTAVIDRVTRGGDEGGGRGTFHWHLVDVERIAEPRKPTGHPQPTWFKPF
jgi:hypothetical protein